jgi:hypothetical protein
VFTHDDSAENIVENTHVLSLTLGESLCFSLVLTQMEQFSNGEAAESARGERSRARPSSASALGDRLGPDSLQLELVSLASEPETSRDDAAATATDAAAPAERRLVPDVAHTIEVEHIADMQTATEWICKATIGEEGKTDGHQVPPACTRRRRTRTDDGAGADPVSPLDPSLSGAVYAACVQPASEGVYRLDGYWVYRHWLWNQECEMAPLK